MGKWGLGQRKKSSIGSPTGIVITQKQIQKIKGFGLAWQKKVDQTLTERKRGPRGVEGRVIRLEKGLSFKI